MPGCPTFNGSVETLGWVRFGPKHTRAAYFLFPEQNTHTHTNTRTTEKTWGSCHNFMCAVNVKHMSGHTDFNTSAAMFGTCNSVKVVFFLLENVEIVLFFSVEQMAMCLLFHQSQQRRKKATSLKEWMCRPISWVTQRQTEPSPLRGDPRRARSQPHQYVQFSGIIYWSLHVDICSCANKLLTFATWDYQCNNEAESGLCFIFCKACWVNAQQVVSLKRSRKHFGHISVAWWFCPHNRMCFPNYVKGVKCALDWTHFLDSPILH